ncbi:hypothetical protein M407DRAFT_161013 [Tulasnella calospora MUT 4182]|uniref:Uncharacterized protein n=1 Tax=Tulasnella calospora MUT 4182 TaxID=1051891 RepID=A0A0C3QQN3_9AGAM|nr:hypothetical protein M407DRAFT_161013 [Tulasnella calospora MUT 4182]
MRTGSEAIVNQSSRGGESCRVHYVQFRNWPFEGKKKHNKRKREERDVSTNVPRDRNVDKRGTKKISEITKPRFVKARIAERKTLIDE